MDRIAGLPRKAAAPYSRLASSKDVSTGDEPQPTHTTFLTANFADRKKG
jgi:hypothetical protein